MSFPLSSHEDEHDQHDQHEHDDFERRHVPTHLKWDDEDAEDGMSTYGLATHGPEPVPDWVITEDAATEEDLGVLKTGKEADVSLIERRIGDRTNLLAAKRYRAAEHRQFHRDAGYLEGRRVRRSRETRAMATRTGFGRDLIAGQWAAAEFDFLGRLWEAGVSVPYPVQLSGTELMMEFIGDDEGAAAPRLAQVRMGAAGEAAHLFEQTVDVMVSLARAGWAHADLSAYNLLVHDGRIVAIDLPQAVEVVVNPKGFDFLHRDCVNICTFFARKGVVAAEDPEPLFGRLVEEAVAAG